MTRKERWDKNCALASIRKTKTKISKEYPHQRSAWKKGVYLYAYELLESLEEMVDDGYVELWELKRPDLLEKALLNGAEDWKQYSYGGCSLCYDGQIAERLCTSSELKRTRNGQNRPNGRETWLDVQYRALYQAHILVQAEMNALVDG